MLESKKMATIGLTYSRIGVTYSHDGVTYSRDGATYSRVGATYSRVGLTYSFPERFIYVNKSVRYCTSEWFQV